MRANKTFDDTVREYVLNHHIKRWQNKDEYTGQKGVLTEPHEIFPGSNRKRCFYVENCIFWVTRETHEKIQGNETASIQLIQNRLKENQVAAIKYYERLKLLVNTFDIKKARFMWKTFFANCEIGEIPLVRCQ